MSHLGLLTVVVDDHDEAIDHYVNDLGFVLVEDTQLPDARWVVVSPPGSEHLSHATRVLLARASTDEQRARVGDQTGGRVFLFLYTADFEADHTRMVEAGIEFMEEPRHEPYGTVAVFRDRFGNMWDLLQPAAR